MEAVRILKPKQHSQGLEVLGDIQVSGDILPLFAVSSTNIIPSHKCHMNMGPILSVYGDGGTRILACVSRCGHVQANAPVALQLANEYSQVVQSHVSLHH
jgi:hypothetical protein